MYTGENGYRNESVNRGQQVSCSYCQSEEHLLVFIVPANQREKLKDSGKLPKYFEFIREMKKLGGYDDFVQLNKNLHFVESLGMIATTPPISLSL